MRCICDLLDYLGWDSSDSADTRADTGAGPDRMRACLRAEEPLALSAEHSAAGGVGERPAVRV